MEKYKNNKNDKVCQSRVDAYKKPNKRAELQKLPPLELHSCMGLNSCKGRDFFGTNDCAGTGSCATVEHPCHTLNECANQGGCGLFGTPEEFCHPGANDCAFQGSCGTPIAASRFIASGPNKGRSVWLLARQLFEERMKERDRTFGDSPCPNGPTLEWLRANVAAGSSCGQAGAKFCSFESHDKAVERREKFFKESNNKLEETCKECNVGVE